MASRPSSERADPALQGNCFPSPNPSDLLEQLQLPRPHGLGVVFLALAKHPRQRRRRLLSPLLDQNRMNPMLRPQLVRALSSRTLATTALALNCTLYRFRVRLLVCSFITVSPLLAQPLVLFLEHYNSSTSENKRDLYVKDTRPHGSAAENSDGLPLPRDQRTRTEEKTPLF